MAIITIPCPRCREPLEVPKPAPPQLKCNFCGVVIKNSPRPAGATPAPAAEKTAVAEAGAARAIAHESKGTTAAAEKTAVAEAGTARAIAADSKGATAAATPRATAPSNTGLIIGLGAVALLVVGLGGLAAWMMMKDGNKDTPVAADQDKKTSPKDDDDDVDEEIPRLEITQSKKNQTKVPLNPRVDNAVKSGVAYLRTMTPARDKAFAKNDHGLGMAALSGLTMLECGIPVDDADVQGLASTIRSNAPQLTKTYLAGPAILFLDRLHKGKTPEQIPAEDRQLIQTLALRIINAQKSGLWGYGAPAIVAAGKGKKARDEKTLLAELRANTYQPKETGPFDLSNTQFAALSLWAARRHGVPVDPALLAASQTVRAGQNKARGTWGYRMTGDNKDNHVDSGTCVGLILLALGRAIENEKNPDRKKTSIVDDDPAVQAGLKHLGGIVARSDRARMAKKAKGKLIKADSGGDLYFLWALERTSLILNIEKINGVDWHAWGSAIILDSQLPSGEWRDSPHCAGVPDTCFALLFLTQANLFQDLTDKLTALTAESGSSPPKKD